jgi:hypothetical protein
MSFCNLLPLMLIGCLSAISLNSPPPIVNTSSTHSILLKLLIPARRCLGGRALHRIYFNYACMYVPMKLTYKLYSGKPAISGSSK